jgi:hypothetical protein
MNNEASVNLTKSLETSSVCLFLVQHSSRWSFQELMDLLPNEQNFDQDKSGQKFHHSLKEHHKISNIPKFRCEML